MKVNLPRLNKLTLWAAIILLLIGYWSAVNWMF